MPPRSTPGTPWQNAQLLTYSAVPASYWALSYGTPCSNAFILYSTKAGGAALPPIAKVYTVPGPLRSVARAAMP